MSITLYEASEAVAKALANIDKAEDDHQREEALAEFEQADAAFVVKLDAVLGLAREFELRAQMRQLEADRLADRARIDLAKAERIRQNVQQQLESAQVKPGDRPIETEHFRVSLHRNPARVEILEPLLVPGRFKTVEQPAPVVTIDKAAIRRAIKAGEDVPGVELTRGTRLDVR